jgi:hypothetical protein
MTLVRAELAATLRRWSEVLAGFGVAVVGLVALRSNDVFFQLLGVLITATGLGLALVAWRRLRFQRDTAAPGLVQVVEGQITYFGPETGGFVGIGSLVELHLVDDGETWLLTTPEESLRIPVAAQGADALFDVFGQLPGLGMSDVLAALDHPQQARTIWLHHSRARQRLGKG